MATARRDLFRSQGARPRARDVRRRGRSWSSVAHLLFWWVAFLGMGFISGYRAHALIRQASGSWPASLEAALDQSGWQPSLPELFSLPGWPGGEPVHILLLGSDRRPDEQVARTDTMMLLTIDPPSRRALLLSLPRDLWVSIPGFGENRLNTAYFLGEVYAYPGGGAQLAKETVSRLMGVPVEYYALVDFRGFVQAVDLLGGVTIEVAEPIWDNRYPDEAYGYQPIYIPAGVQHMDGETLLKYVRTRYIGNDFDRIRRQQQALRALAERAASLDLLPRLPELVATFGGTFSTDLEAWQLVALAELGRQIGLLELELRAIDNTLSVPIVTWDGAEVLLPDLEGIRLLMTEFVSGS